MPIKLVKWRDLKDIDSQQSQEGRKSQLEMEQSALEGKGNF
jgi:hypothetical protein